MIYDRDHPDPNGGQRGYELATASFALTPTTVVQVVLDLGVVVHPMEQIVQHDARDASFVSYDRLPDDFKAEVQKFVESMQKRG
jgi:hypothetical protein